MSRMMTVEVLGVDLEVEFEQTPYVAARTSGPPESCSPAEGGQINITSVFLDCDNITEMLKDWVFERCQEQVAERLANEPADEPCYEGSTNGRT